MNRSGGVLLNFLLMGAVVAGAFFALSLIFDKSSLSIKNAAGMPEQAAPAASPAEKPKPKAVIIVPGDPKSIAARGKPWARFSGRVFDLATLKPASGLDVLLRHQISGETTAVTADARGRFKAGLLISDGAYELRFERDGKPVAYMEDWTPSVAKLGLEKRMELSKEPVEPEILFALGPEPLAKTYAVFNP